MYKIPKTHITFYSAAIRFFDERVGMITELYGKRHHEIIRRINSLGQTASYKNWHEDGFIVAYKDYDTPRFINREEATSLAREYKIPMISSTLTSEDLW